MTQTDALDEALRRFPYRLKQWRAHGIPSAELHQLAPLIRAEYRLVLKQRRHAQDAKPQFIRRERSLR
jgi:hypothetical protein